MSELDRMVDDGCPNVPDPEPEAAKDATFSACRKYRYTLKRRWDGAKEYMVFVMLNPSTADANLDDPTIRRCIGFAKREGAGGIVVLNLYALRSTDPVNLHRVHDPVGPDNDSAIRFFARAASHRGAPVVFAWGTLGKIKPGRDRHVAALFVAAGCKPKCLGLSSDGSPLHPLYLPGTSPLITYPTPWIKEHDQTDLGASDDRPLGPDHPVYRSG